MADTRLVIDGEVAHSVTLSFNDLAAIPDEFQIADVSRIDPARRGAAVKLAGLLARVQPRPSVRYLTLHASADDFHASIPLEPLRERAFLIYALDGQPLPSSAGGPMRFFIPEFAACHTAEIDECANVKFVDRLEFTATAGHDNRPHDANEHAALHERETKP